MPSGMAVAPGVAVLCMSSSEIGGSSAVPARAPACVFMTLRRLSRTSAVWDTGGSAYWGRPALRNPSTMSSKSAGFL
jgi:hypothetical protein